MTKTKPATDAGRALTDLGNGERFAAQHGDAVRQCPAWGKWLAWNGSRWPIDDTGAVMRLAKLTAKSIVAEAQKADDYEHKRDIIEWADRSQAVARLNAMLKLAASELPIPISHESLDADPYLLCNLNGTLELNTGELRENRQDDLLTLSTNVEYPDDAGAESPLWSEFLFTIFDGNTELIGFVQRLMGLALIGEQVEHLMPVFHGAGANGKSVFVNTCMAAMGDYARIAPPGLFMASRMERHATELAYLFRKRLVVAAETKDAQRLDEGLVKSITGGDRITARRMREDFWEFTPSHLALIVTNHKPDISGTDHGIWRRIKLVPFGVTIPPKQRDPDLPTKLRRELPSVLHWMVQGCLAYQRDGLNPPAIVEAATGDYQDESDTFGRWIKERCETTLHSFAKAAHLLESYNQWASKVHERERSQRWLAAELSKRGFTKDTGRDGVTWHGVGLRYDPL